MTTLSIKVAKNKLFTLLRIVKSHFVKVSEEVGVKLKVHDDQAIII